jgi:hypothetical protein
VSRPSPRARFLQTRDRIQNIRALSAREPLHHFEQPHQRRRPDGPYARQLTATPARIAARRAAGASK